MNKTMRIKLEFDTKSNGYGMIVITPTHFNSKGYRRFIKDEDAEIINKTVGLHNFDNHRETSLYRSKTGVLFITYKLKRNMYIHETYKSIQKYF